MKFLQVVWFEMCFQKQKLKSVFVGLNLKTCSNKYVEKVLSIFNRKKKQKEF